MLLPVLTYLLAVQAGAAPTVSVDLRPLPERSYRELDGVTVERKIALRLVQDGFAVVSVDQPQADIRLELAGNARVIDLRARSREGHLSRRVASNRFASLAEIHLELCQKASELADALRRRLPPPVVATPAPPPALAPPVDTVRPEPPPEAVPRPLPLVSSLPTSDFELGLYGNVLWRSGGADGLGLLAVRWRRGSFGLTLELGGSGSESAPIWVLELSAALGPSWFFLETPRWEGALSLEGGVLYQRAHVTDAYASDREDGRILAAGWVPVFVAFRVTRHFSIAVRAGAGLSQGVTHESEGLTLWSRGGLRGEAGVGLQWRLE